MSRPGLQTILALTSSAEAQAPEGAVVDAVSEIPRTSAVAVIKNWPGALMGHEMVTLAPASALPYEYGPEKAHVAEGLPPHLPLPE